MNNLAVHLAETGRRSEAVTAAREAVELRRELVETNGERVWLYRAAQLSDLAMSAINLAVRLAEAGRRTEALTTPRKQCNYVVSWSDSTATPTCPTSPHQ